MRYSWPRPGDVPFFDLEVILRPSNVRTALVKKILKITEALRILLNGSTSPFSALASYSVP